ncbi:hypothetical protein C8R47DRAFT_1200865 [Mycena vitilis]|nr:hypothetical protein C8R47DRAFT_1200865 [Mycena vitilis]
MSLLRVWPGLAFLRCVSLFWVTTSSTNTFCRLFDNIKSSWKIVAARALVYLSWTSIFWPQFLKMMWDNVLNGINSNVQLLPGSTYLLYVRRFNLHWENSGAQKGRTTRFFAQALPRYRDIAQLWCSSKALFCLPYIQMAPILLVKDVELMTPTVFFISHPLQKWMPKAKAKSKTAQSKQNFKQSADATETAISPLQYQIKIQAQKISSTARAVYHSHDCITRLSRGRLQW